MNLHQAKTAIPGWKDKVLQFSKSDKPTKGKDGKEYIWVNGWDDETRTRVSMTQQLFDKVRTGEEINTLGIQTKTKISKESEGKPGKEYTQCIIFEYTAGDAGEL